MKNLAHPADNLDSAGMPPLTRLARARRLAPWTYLGVVFSKQFPPVAFSAFLKAPLPVSANGQAGCAAT